MLHEPGGEGVRGAVREEIDGTTGFDVDEDRSVGTSLAERELIHAENPDGPDGRIGQDSQLPQDRRPSSPKPQSRREPGSGAATHGQPERLEHAAHGLSPTGMTPGQRLDLLYECSSAAGSVAAEESTDEQAEHDASATQRPVRQPPPVRAVNSRSDRSAARTDDAAAIAAGLDPDRFAIGFHFVDDEVFDLRPDQLPEPALDPHQGNADGQAALTRPVVRK